MKEIIIEFASDAFYGSINDLFCLIDNDNGGIIKQLGYTNIGGHGKYKIIFNLDISINTPALAMPKSNAVWFILFDFQGANNINFTDIDYRINSEHPKCLLAYYNKENDSITPLIWND